MDLDTAIQDKINHWLEGNYDEATKEEIRRLLNQDNGAKEELEDAFYKNLEFGTGGLRGVMGVGSNRMNKYTVGMATQGLANYLKKQFPESDIKVAVTHDNRNNSRYFAEITADVFSANGIYVYLTPELRPTPQLSFAIRYFNCQSGVMLTASHNPKEYNGYKAYWEDGGQLIPPHDENVIAEVQKIERVDDIKFDRDSSKIEITGEAFDEAYLESIKALSLAPETIKKQKDLKIVFSGLHGTGSVHVPAILKKFGFENVEEVKEQATPNGNFPTVENPNPEEPEAMKMALQQGKASGADLVMATDPDADRVGIAVKNHKGEYQLLNGNQTGALLFHYVLQAAKEAGKLNGNEYIVKTIVTTDLLDRMAEDFGVECYNVLTGFKYIADVIRRYEHEKQFLIGGEESYGYLVGDYVRDKDAVAACAFIAEMTAWIKEQGKTVFDQLMEIYERYGFYKEELKSIKRPGKKGSEEITEMMRQFREEPPSTINGSRLIKLKDYQKQKSFDITAGSEESIDLPKSNVLQFITEDGSKISARPSGTEPKIKFYFSVNAPLSSKDAFDKVNEALQERIQDIIDDLGLK